MPYRHDGQGMGGGPIPDKTVGWMWGFLCGAIFVIAIDVISVILFVVWHQ